MPTRRQCANALRALAIDAIEQSRSGHPGAPLGMADMAEALWRHLLRHNPADPHWPDRDRFVLSNGLAKDVKNNAGLKVLGDGELAVALTVRAAKFSASAKEGIEKAGGTAETV